MKTKAENELLERMRLHQRAVAGALALLLLLPLAVRGGGVVTSPTESNLRAAMAGGGTVTFACDGTITLAATITNSTDTALDGSGRQIIISGSNAVRVFYVTTKTTLRLINLVVSDGSAAAGAGIFNDGELLLQECSFARNNAVGAPGSDGVWWPATRPTPGQNACGGAIYNAGTLKADLSTFRGNSARGGDGATGVHGDLFPGGGGGAGSEGGDGIGGVIFNTGLATVNASTFIDNQVIGGPGGAGGLGGPGTSGGTSGGGGGSGGAGSGAALFNSGGIFYLANCVAISNLCAGGSGGLGGSGGDAATGAGGMGGGGGRGGSGFGAIWADDLCFLTNCTVTFNLAIPGSGGIGGSGGSGEVYIPPGVPGIPGNAGGGIKSAGCWMANTLLATNTPNGNCIGTINDGGHNLSSDGSCAFTKVGSLNNADPKLGPLADNGGPTLTMALLADSPAIDAGDNAAAPSTDQRGFPRPAGLAADIGAFEYGSMLPVLTINRSGETEMEIVVCANSNRPCRLFASSDLVNWQCVATNQIGPDGTALFQDNCGNGESQRFYRATMP